MAAQPIGSNKNQSKRSTAALMSYVEKQYI
jgi:hypothetical protein